jgi:hypothetical protein
MLSPVIWCMNSVNEAGSSYWSRKSWVALDLRTTGLQRRGERVPMAGVGGHSDHHPADVGGLGAVQVQVGGRRVGIPVTVALEHAERDQRVQPVGGAT